MNNSDKIEYEQHPHRFGRTIAGKGLCCTCGLVRLNNNLTHEAVKLGCDYKHHPSWQHKVKKYGNPLNRFEERI